MTTKDRKLQDLPDTYQQGFLNALDSRRKLTELLRANYDEITADLGGKQEISHIKSALVERFVWLEAVLNKLEKQMFEDEAKFDNYFSRWIQAINSLTGMARQLGMERVQPVADLESYLNNGNGKGKRK